MMIEKMEFKVSPLRHVETAAVKGYTLLARKAGRGAYNIGVADDGVMYQVPHLRDAHQRRRELSGSPLIAVNQVWVDCDPRSARHIRIIGLEMNHVVYSTCQADGSGFGRHLRAKYDAFQLDGQEVARGFSLTNRSR
ncbi:hypothetical protein [Cupriavidus sp. DL-D2]|uniref:hypothetical protein n=1 Tax=Cupriavidus sp. DL-D2 TaxID=3144974 RepID=UPI0032145B1A